MSKDRRADAAEPPTVDQGEPPRTGAALAAFLAPVPGRWAKTVRLTGVVLAIIAISETFRIPDAAVSAYMAIIFSAADENATQRLARLGGIVISASIVLAVGLFIVDLSQPALRLGLMGLSTFAAGYLSRRFGLGMVAIVSGLFVVAVQRSGDDLLSGSLSAGTVSNATSGTLPELAFMSPEEALLHNVLWELLAFVYPIAVVFLVNRFAARPPSETLRRALVDRLGAAAAYCRDEPGGEDRLVEAGRSGLPAVLAQADLAAKVERGRYDPEAGRRLIDGVSRLVLALLAWRHMRRLGHGPPVPPQAGDACAALASRLEVGDRRKAARRDAPGAEAFDPSVSSPRGVAAPLAVQLDASLAEIRDVLDGVPEAHAPRVDPGGRKPAPGGADRDPGPARFGMKLTLAVMSAYLFMSLSDWSQISTCLTTCFVLALDSLGNTYRKLLLRVSGALAGGAVGFAAILLVMPLLTDLGGLFLLLAPVLLAFIWIRVGSERVAYFGQQAAFAFLLTVVQDYGPTLEFQAARNRIVGILVGEVVMFVIFTNLWPERVGDIVRRALADAFGALADLLDGRAAGGEAAAYRRFDAAVAKARAALPDDAYEAALGRSPAHGVIDARTLSRVQALVVPVSILAGLRGEACATAKRDMAGWLGDCADWIRTGRGGETLAASLPRHPVPGGAGSAWTPDAACPVWLRVLDQELRDLLDDVPARRGAGHDRPRGTPDRFGVAGP